MADTQPNQDADPTNTTKPQTSNLSTSLLNTPCATADSRGSKSKIKFFPCTWPGCSCSFVSKHNVKQHIRERHTFEKPFTCDACAAIGNVTGFSRRYGLTRHMNSKHRDDRKITKAEPVDIADALPSTKSSQDTGAIESTETEVLPARVKDEPDVVSDVVETSGFHFRFDADMSGSDDFDVQNGGGLICGECGYAAAKHDEIVTHLHAVHQAPNSCFCTCSVCAAMFMPSEEDAVLLLDDGAFNFHVERGVEF
jgi:hypothetical protein